MGIRNSRASDSSVLAAQEAIKLVVALHMLRRDATLATGAAERGSAAPASLCRHSGKMIVPAAIFLMMNVLGFVALRNMCAPRGASPRRQTGRACPTRAALAGVGPRSAVAPLCIDMCGCPFAWTCAVAPLHGHVRLPLCMDMCGCTVDASARCMRAKCASVAACVQLAPRSPAPPAPVLRAR